MNDWSWWRGVTSSVVTMWPFGALEYVVSRCVASRLVSPSDAESAYPTDALPCRSAVRAMKVGTA